VSVAFDFYALLFDEMSIRNYLIWVKVKPLRWLICAEPCSRMAWLNVDVKGQSYAHALPAFGYFFSSTLGDPIDIVLRELLESLTALL